MEGGVRSGDSVQWWGQRQRDGVGVEVEGQGEWWDVLEEGLEVLWDVVVGWWEGGGSEIGGVCVDAVE